MIHLHDRIEPSSMARLFKRRSVKSIYDCCNANSISHRSGKSEAKMAALLSCQPLFPTLLSPLFFRWQFLSIFMSVSLPRDFGKQWCYTLYKDLIKVVTTKWSETASNLAWVSTVITKNLYHLLWFLRLVFDVNNPSKKLLNGLLCLF